MQTLLPKCVAFATLVTLAGCGSSSSGGGSVARENFASESAKATCHHIYKCCDATELMSDTTWGTTEAECVTMQTPLVTTSLMTQQAGVDAGRIAYHADRAKQCLDSITALSCDWGIYYSAHNVTGCAHVFDGTVATGSTCTMDEECTSGFCMGGTTCAARGASGDACTPRPAARTVSTVRSAPATIASPWRRSATLAWSPWPARTQLRHSGRCDSGDLRGADDVQRRLAGRWSSAARPIRDGAPAPRSGRASPSRRTGSDLGRA